jgi:hypothetical protein
MVWLLCRVEVPDHRRESEMKKPPPVAPAGVFEICCLANPGRRGAYDYTYGNYPYDSDDINQQQSACTGGRPGKVKAGKVT